MKGLDPRITDQIAQILTQAQKIHEGYSESARQDTFLVDLAALRVMVDLTMRAIVEQQVDQCVSRAAAVGDVAEALHPLKAMLRFLP